jgi:hypothetical protein
MNTVPFANSRGVCPACQTTVRYEPVTLQCNETQVLRHEGKPLIVNAMMHVAKISVHDPADSIVMILGVCLCPECRRLCISEIEAGRWTLLYPATTPPRTLPETVDEDIAREFLEAAKVLPVSPKASAALSRRCLELMLTKRGHTQSKLVDKINSAEKEVPSYLRSMMDMVRLLGNICAHAKEDVHTGEIVEVESHEAELMLQILERLADFYYVQPAETDKKLAGVRSKVDSTKKAKSGQPGSPKPLA